MVGLMITYEKRARIDKSMFVDVLPQVLIELLKCMQSTRGKGNKVFDLQELEWHIEQDEHDVILTASIQIGDDGPGGNNLNSCWI